MDRDERTQLPTLSANSQGWLQASTETLKRTTSASDILKQFARLSANYGDSRIATNEQRTLLLREWLEAFRHHAPDHLHAAVTQAMKATKFWPTIAEVEVEVRAIRREVIEAVDVATGRTRYKSDTDGFARNGRTEAEEIAHRVAQTKRWREQAAGGQPEYTDPIEAKAEPKGASQAMTVSYAVYHSCSARRARGEQTCEPNCLRSRPGVRSCQIDQRLRVIDGMDAEDIGTKSAASDDLGGSEPVDGKWRMTL